MGECDSLFAYMCARRRPTATIKLHMVWMRNVCSHMSKMYVCMYVCVRVYVCLFMCVHVCLCLHRMYAHAEMCLSTHMILLGHMRNLQLCAWHWVRK